MHLRSLGTSLVLFSASLCVNIFAQDDSDSEAIMNLSLKDLMDIEVTTASKKAQKISEAPSNLSVITSNQIEEWGVHDMKELLNRAVNVPVIPDRDEWVFAMRGNLGDNNQKYLILIDGHRMNSIENFGPGQIIEMPMNLSNVNRVEIIRGPGSAVWGADALAGVINIITKTAKDLEGETTDIGFTGTVGYDNANTIETEYPLSGTVDFQAGKIIGEDGEILLSGAIGSSQGFNILQSQSNGFSKNVKTPSTRVPLSNSDTAVTPATFSTKIDKHRPSYMFQAKAKLGEFSVNAFTFATETYNRQLEYGYGRENYLTTYKSFVEGGYTKETSNAGTITAKISTDVNRAEYQPFSQDDSVAAGQINIVWLERRLSTSLDYNVDISEAISLGAGLDYSFTKAGPNQRINNYFVNLTSDSASKRSMTAYWFDPLLEDHQIGGYMQTQYSPIKLLSFVAGIRVDYNNQRGSDKSNVNPRLACMLFPAENTSIKFLYNRGYLRPANFQSAFIKESIESESMNQFDLILMQKLRNFSFTANGFYQKLSGFINLLPGGSYNYRNTADYSSYGGEFEASYALGAHDIWANYFYTIASSENFNDLLAYNNRRVDLDGKLLNYPSTAANIGATIRLLNNTVFIAPHVRIVGSTTYRKTSVLKASSDKVSYYGETSPMAYLNCNVTLKQLTHMEISMFGNNLLNLRDQVPQSVWNGIIGQPGIQGGLKVTAKF